MKSALPYDWHGLCAPVMVTGQMIVLNTKVDAPGNRTKRRLDKRWHMDDQIYISWNQEPVGVPDEHLAIPDAWVKTGTRMDTPSGICNKFSVYSTKW